MTFIPADSAAAPGKSRRYQTIAALMVASLLIAIASAIPSQRSGLFLSVVSLVSDALFFVAVTLNVYDFETKTRLSTVDARHSRGALVASLAYFAAYVDRHALGGFVSSEIMFTVGLVAVAIAFRDEIAEMIPPLPGNGRSGPGNARARSRRCP